MKRALQFGLVSCPIGIAVGIHVAVNSERSWFPVSAGLAAFAVPFLFWWIIIERRNRDSLILGTLCGAISGIIAHPVCWYIQILAINICYWVFGSCFGSLDEPPANIIYGLWASIVFSFGSLLFYGGITLVLGAATGFLFVLYSARSSDKDQGIRK